MDLDKFLKLAETLEKKKKGKKEELEKLQKLFERFHLLNRNYLEKDAYEKAQGSIPSISEAIAGTVRYLDAEVTHLRSKRMKLPFENVELAEMQKVQTRNEMLLKEFLSQFPE
jgi:C-terminal processing protease CtpA/Prc